MTQDGDPLHHVPLHIGELDDKGTSTLTVADVVQIARDKRLVADLSDAVWQRMKQSAEWIDAVIESIQRYERELDAYVDALNRGEKPTPPEKPDAYYGINTGFGAQAGKASLATVYDTHALSRNLIVSHTAGVGDYLDEETVRAAMLLRAHSLARGYSGVRRELVEKLVAMLNAGVYPAVPSKGSLGASGDLAPLSHLALTLTTAPEAPSNRLPHQPAVDPVDAADGEAFVQYDTTDGKGRGTRATRARDGEVPAFYHMTTHRRTGQQTLWRRVRGSEAMQSVGGQIALRAKEGLAFNNGATFSTAIAALTLHDAWNVLRNAEVSLALSLEGMRGFRDAFLAPIHAVRGHLGAIDTAAQIMRYVDGSQLLDPGHYDHDPRRKPPQDPYSLRCAPQVLGMVCDTLRFITETVETEVNAATDNPLIFNTEDLGAERKYKAVSGGNFHGEPIAMSMDFLKVAMTELGSIAERRIFQLTDYRVAPEEGVSLPNFLIDEPRDRAVSSGFMIAQYTAASLISDCKTLAHPDSVDSIPSSANKEDHVSMSFNAARHAREIVDNVEAVVAIELLCAAQAIDLQLNLNMGLTHADVAERLQHLGAGTRAAYEMIRIQAGIPFLQHDRVLARDIRALIQMVRRGDLVDAAAQATARAMHAVVQESRGGARL